MRKTYARRLAGSLLLALSLTHPSTAKPFDAQITSGGIAFHIQATDRGALNRLTITPHGLSEDNRPVTMEIDGIVTDAQSADLNGDGYPELYIFVSGTGSGSYGNVIAFTANRKKSMSQIHFCDVNPKKRMYRGYMGHDSFRIEKGYLIRRFPLYKNDDPNCCPSRGYRKIYYRLVPGEAMWQLKAVTSVDRKY